MLVILGSWHFYVFLLAIALLCNAPLVLIVRATRLRLHPRLGRGLIAAGFAATAIYMIWRMDWFDMWRHGTFGIRYMLTALGPYTAALALSGWILGGLIIRRSPSSRPITARRRSATFS
jgi:hypothetical protein